MSASYERWFRRARNSRVMADDAKHPRRKHCPTKCDVGHTYSQPKTRRYVLAARARCTRPRPCDVDEDPRPGPQ